MNQSTFNVAQSLQQVSDQIRHFESLYKRPENSVQLLAVSKTKPAELVQSAIDAGQRAFGENYPDEAFKKIELLGSNNCEWHFIGALQSRKAASIAKHFAWVHGIDRLKVISKLAQNRSSELPPLNVCLQVNIDNETSKSGAKESELPALAEACASYPQLKLRGVMAIPAPRTNLLDQREVFAKVRKLKEQLQTSYPSVDTLSMGMSADMEAAIAEGATIVRIGTALFGSRMVK